MMPGTPVQVRTAFGEWIDAVASSGVEGTHRNGKKIHDFPVVWVLVGGDRLPWPAEDVVARAEGGTA